MSDRAQKTPPQTARLFRWLLFADDNPFGSEPESAIPEQELISQYDALDRAVDILDEDSALRRVETAILNRDRDLIKAITLRALLSADPWWEVLSRVSYELTARADDLG